MVRLHNDTNIRVILRKQLEEETLQKMLEADYDSTPDDVKTRMRNQMAEIVESKIDNILNAFISALQNSGPEVKKRKYLTIINLVLTALTQIGIAYAVNTESWFFVTVLALIILAFQSYMIKTGY